MNEIDELFRGFLRDAPTPEPGTAERVARNAAVTRTDRRGWIHRTAAIAAGLGAAALAVIVGILLVQAPSGPRNAASQTFGDARANWGMTATVLIEPAPDATLDETISRFISAIEIRSRNSDIPGLGVSRSGANVVTITISGADRSTDFSNLVNFRNIDVFDLSTALIASGGSLQDLATPARAVGGSPVRYAVQPGALAQIMLVNSQAEADDLLRQAGWENGTAVPLPGDVVLVDRQSADLPRVMLIRDQPIVSAGQLDHVTFEGSRFEVVPTASAKAAVVSALDRAGAPVSRELSLVNRHSAGRGYEYGSSSLVERTSSGVAFGGFPVSSDDHAAFSPAGEPILDAKLVVQSSTPYGAAPAPEGDRNVPLPALLAAENLTYTEFASGRGEHKQVAVEKRSLVRTISVEAEGHTWTAYAARTAEGGEATWFGSDTDDMSPGSSPCGAGAGIPILRSCGALSIGNAGAIVGRVRHTVASIEARTTTGGTLYGSVRNGWFLIPYGKTETSPQLPRVEVIARDEQGREIGRLDEFGRLRTP